MAKIIAIANQKGGVGKTTATFNLGHALAELGKAVLLIDLDPQASLTLTSGIDPLTVKGGTLELFRAVESGNMPDTVQLRRDLHIIPTNLDLSIMSLELSNQIDPNGALKAALLLDNCADTSDDNCSMAAVYDFILIDCPPTLDRLTINAFVAAHELIVPCCCSFLDYGGIKLVLQTMKRVKALNPGLKLRAVVPTKYDGGRTHDKTVLETMQQEFGSICREPVPNRTDYQNASSSSRPVSGKLWVYWQDFAQEIINNG